MMPTDKRSCIAISVKHKHAPDPLAGATVRSANEIPRTSKFQLAGAGRAIRGSNRFGKTPVIQNRDAVGFHARLAP
jgi:hypothetical protein